MCVFIWIQIAYSQLSKSARRERKIAIGESHEGWNSKRGEGEERRGEKMTRNTREDGVCLDPTITYRLERDNSQFGNKHGMVVEQTEMHRKREEPEGKEEEATNWLARSGSAI